MTIRHSQFIQALALVILLAALALAERAWSLSAWFQTDRLAELLNRAKKRAPLGYIALMAGALVVNPIPILPLDVEAGAFFGFWLGTLYSILGVMIDTSMAFGIANYLRRGGLKVFIFLALPYLTERYDFMGWAKHFRHATNNPEGEV